jgi:adenylyl cyclase-associated protein
MTDAAQFYTNRVLKDFKDKDPVHVEWVKQWLKTLNELHAYVKQYHTTGLTWGGHAQQDSNGSAARNPPIPPLSNIQIEESPSRNGIMGAINSLGISAASQLKKVPDELKVHKNPQLKEQTTTTTTERSTKSPVSYLNIQLNNCHHSYLDSSIKAYLRSTKISS